MRANAVPINVSALFFLASVFLGSASCSEDEEYSGFKKDSISPGVPSIEARQRVKSRKVSGPIKKQKIDDGKMQLPRLTETDFIRSPLRRDPFEPFVEIFKKETTERTVQREVKLKEYDVSDLRLIGIITNIGNPRGMVVVPDGTGFVLKRGDYVGRADVVKQGSSGEPVHVNWRVARIHGSGKEEERGIYLIRDDPTTTKGVDITRFLPLHPSE